MKRTFVVPDSKEVIYEKFKALVPEVSCKLVELMEEYVNHQEAISAQMVEQKIYDGKDRSGIFIGDIFIFNGLLITEGYHAGQETNVKIFLTKKGKFLVSYKGQNELNLTIGDGGEECGGGEDVYWYEVYEDYFDMKDKAELPANLITPVEAYLNKNSVVRTYKVLDI